MLQLTLQPTLQPMPQPNLASLDLHPWQRIIEQRRPPSPMTEATAPTLPTQATTTQPPIMESLLNMQLIPSSSQVLTRKSAIGYPTHLQI